MYRLLQNKPILNCICICNEWPSLFWTNYYVFYYIHEYLGQAGISTNGRITRGILTNTHSHAHITHVKSIAK